MKTVIKTTLLTLLLLLASSLAVFAAIRLSGGDVTAARLPASATAADRDEFRAQMGLDQPILKQYVTYLGDLVRGDLGNSLTNNAEISSLAVDKIKNSLVLGLMALLLVFGIGVPLGMLASLKRNSWLDTGITSMSVTPDTPLRTTFRTGQIRADSLIRSRIAKGDSWPYRLPSRQSQNRQPDCIGATPLRCSVTGRLSARHPTQSTTRHQARLSVARWSTPASSTGPHSGF